MKLINILTKKEVDIAIISKYLTPYVSSPEDATLLKGCTTSFPPDVDNYGDFKQILTAEEQYAAEKELGYEEGALSVHKKEDNFWKQPRMNLVFTRTTDDLESATLRLDLNKIYDWLKYKIALAHRLVANTWAEKDRSTDYKFVIRSNEDLYNEVKSKTDIKANVAKYLLTNEKSQKSLFNLVRLYGQKGNASLKDVTHKQSKEWLYAQLWTLTENTKDLKVLHSIIKEDKDVIANKVFILDGISSGAIMYNGSNYRLSGGGIIGYSEEEVIRFFKDGTNQQEKVSVEDTINKFFKIK